MGFNRRQQKRRRYVDSCEPRVFTDWLPSVIPAQARITARARRAAARSIGDHCRPVSGVAVEFVAYTDEVLTEGPPPVGPRDRRDPPREATVRRRALPDRLSYNCSR